jgi:hypothetical protein
MHARGRIDAVFPCASTPLCRFPPAKRAPGRSRTAPVERGLVTFPFGFREAGERDPMIRAAWACESALRSTKSWEKRSIGPQLRAGISSKVNLAAGRGQRRMDELAPLEGHIYLRQFPSNSIYLR